MHLFHFASCCRLICLWINNISEKERENRWGGWQQAIIKHQIVSSIAPGEENNLYQKKKK